jgi:glycosyltransferase involved in cell wall biosynthesis
MERVLSELIVGLHERGHEVTVIARSCELPAGVLSRFVRVRGPSRPFLLAYPWFLLRASLMLRRARSGIVQATGGIVLAPVDVVSVHYCHQVGPANPSRSSALFRLNTRIVSVCKRWSERLCFWVNRRATFVCVSEGVAAEVREHYPRLAPRVITIHNGVDSERFAPDTHRQAAEELRRELGIARERLIVLFVGGEWERKGLRQAIEALQSAREWSLVVAGAGDQPSYSALAASLGVSDAVHWLGVRGDLERVYAMSDAFLMPTSYETFSLATFEAAASGLPLLASAVNGISELLVDGHNGFYVERSAVDIARRLRELSSDPRRRAVLGAAARRSALAFSWATMVDRHADLYERMTASRATPNLDRG